MTEILAIAAALMLAAGSFFTLVAAIGLIRLPDLFTRMHAASKAGAVGAGLLLVAAGLYSGELSVLARAIAGFFFLILTTPVSAHLLARASIIAGNNPQEYKLRSQKNAGKS
jgi:multicomponent Na+:H+ antiporter subunit G